MFSEESERWQLVKLTENLDLALVDSAEIMTEDDLTIIADVVVRLFVRELFGEDKDESMNMKENSNVQLVNL